jgi:peptidoglycan/xylan/chitin deacetylase (PgdA/CDA1 family)
VETRLVAEPRSIELRLEVDDEQLEELERALLKARAAELGEVRRRQVRFTAGYGDATTREVLDDEGRRAQIRYDVLTRLLDSVREARGRT